MVMAIESTGPLTCAQHMTKTYSYGHKCITQINNKNSLSKKQVCFGLSALHKDYYIFQIGLCYLSGQLLSKIAAINMLGRYLNISICCLIRGSKHGKCQMVL